MKALDLNAAVVQAVLPWEFSLTVNGQTYATRTPTVAQLAIMQSIDGKPDEEVRSFVTGLFAEPLPHVDQWEGELVGAAIIAILGYFAEWSKKKSQRLLAHVSAFAAAEITGTTAAKTSG